MKSRIILLVFITPLVLVTSLMNAFGQEDKSKRPSPPATASRKVGSLTITINYGQPSVKTRKIWGAIVPYGKVWRAGANEATTFEIDKDAKINGLALPKGKYAFFVIPNENEWQLIFNKVPGQWGAFKYDSTLDVLRIAAKPAKSAAFNEKLIYTINPNGRVTLAWENKQVSFSVK